jgi:hypothetical protein
MVHSVRLYGPGLIAFVAVSVLIWAGSAYVAIDAVRRLRTDYAGVAEGRWFYAIPQAVFFVLFFAWQIPWVEANLPWIGWMVVAIPIVLAQQMAYLLRVVFPTAKRLEKRLEAETAAGITRPVTGARRSAGRRATDRRRPVGVGGDEDVAVESPAEPPADTDTGFFDDDDGSTPDA